jgi:serine/threonine protein kinase
MPPEVWKQPSYDFKTDVYAYGMCALEMLTKTAPYSECVTGVEVFARQVQVPTYRQCTGDRVAHVTDQYCYCYCALWWCE